MTDIPDKLCVWEKPLLGIPLTDAEKKQLAEDAARATAEN